MVLGCAVCSQCLFAEGLRMALRHRCDARGESWYVLFDLPRRMKTPRRAHWFSKGLRRTIWFSCAKYGCDGARRLALKEFASTEESKASDEDLLNNLDQTEDSILRREAAASCR